MAGQGTTARGPGRSAGLDRGRIVEVAGTMPPDELTMQAVADRLGVDRKAVHHHVGDRDALLSLVALDTFRRHSASFTLPSGQDWRTACSTYAAGFAACIVATGAYAEHLPMTDPVLAGVLDPTESVIGALVSRGLDVATTQRVVAALVNVALAHARDTLAVRRSPQATRAAQLRAALSGQTPGAHPYLEEILAAPADTYGPEQLQLTVDLLLDGVQARLLDG
ncbi:MAG: TetR/AcrR family transcriptional regulator [Nocardioides sp.]|uniref:TetR/AcrR family transcriptional regulator n=1 Tax=Nocardioides sp. TaxID=35761 RepID=UPI003F047777